MARLIEVRVPDMGNFKDVAVIDVIAKPGDAIEAEGSLVTIETEKATMDVPSTASGIVDKIHVKKGALVSAGDLIATVTVEGEGEAPAPAPAASSSGSAAKAEPAKAAPAAAGANGGAPAAAKSEAPAKAVPAPAPAATKPALQSAPAPAASSSNGGASPAAAEEAPASTRLRDDMPQINEPGFSRAHAGPSVRKLARELGVDLTKVTGTGPKARVTHEDVKGFVKKVLSGAAQAPGAGGGLPQIPAVDFSQFGPTEVKPLTRIQRISGPRLHASWVNIPHVTQYDLADITDLEETRGKLKSKAAEQNIKLTPLAFIVRAVVKALQEYPLFNSSLDPSGTSLIMKKYIHVGFAADTPNGLLVPVLRDANRKDVYEVARLLGELSEKARNGKLSGTEMQGGSFTISSLGGIGGTAFTPIINAPEVAILGVSRSSMQPVYQNGAFVPRLMLPLSLSYDHRVIDGASAARFITFLSETLADARGLVEAVP